MAKWIYTNRSTPDELQRYLDDGAEIGALIFAQGGYEVELVNGRPAVYGKRNGVTNKRGAPTTAFDIVREKHNEVGFYCLNIREFFAGNPWVDQLPDHVPYTGLFETDDISAWVDNGENET